MKTRIYANHLRIGGSASEFIREVEGSHRTPVKENGEPKKVEAFEILESFQENNKDPNEIDLGIMDGKFLNRRLEYGLKEFKVIPYFLSAEARAKGEGISEGSPVTLVGDERIFRVVCVLYEQESVRLEDENHNEFLVPWGLIRRCTEEE